MKTSFFINYLPLMITTELFHKQLEIKKSILLLLEGGAASWLAPLVPKLASRFFKKGFSTSMLSRIGLFTHFQCWIGLFFLLKNYIGILYAGSGSCT